MATFRSLALLVLASCAWGKPDRDLLKRLERLEAAVAKAEKHEALSKDEVHERFRLFHEASQQELWKLQDQLAKMQGQMTSLQQELLRKAEAQEVLRPEEVHERFRLFAQTQAAQPVVEKTSCSPVVQADVMSRSEVHERFRLFQQAMGRPCTSEQKEMGTQEVTMPPSASLELPDVMTRAEIHERFRLFQQSLNSSPCPEHQTIEVPAVQGWISWLLSLALTSAGLLLGLFSLCVALGEAKAQQDRLTRLEECVQESLAQSAVVVEEPMAPKMLSGAAGAALGSTTGAISGSLAGGTLGAVVGLVPAVFTLGFSVPLGAAMGSSLGLVCGSVVGGGTGALGGVRAAKWYKARHAKVL